MPEVGRECMEWLVQKGAGERGWRLSRRPLTCDSVTGPPIAGMIHGSAGGRPEQSSSFSTLLDS